MTEESGIAALGHHDHRRRMQVALPQQVRAPPRTIFEELGTTFGGDSKVVEYVSEPLGATGGEEFALISPHR